MVMNIPIEVNIEKTTCNKLFLLNNKNKIENNDDKKYNILINFGFKNEIS